MEFVICGMKDSYPAMLHPGGQKTTIAIARGLAMHPELTPLWWANITTYDPETIGDSTCSYAKTGTWQDEYDHRYVIVKVSIILWLTEKF